MFYESLHNDLYKMEDRGDEAYITVNKDTVVYTDVYHKSRTSAAEGAVDMMINTLGYAEFLAIKHGDDMKELYWQRARRSPSTPTPSSRPCRQAERNGGGLMTDRVCMVNSRGRSVAPSAWKRHYRTGGQRRGRWSNGDQLTFFPERARQPRCSSLTRC